MNGLRHSESGATLLELMVAASVMAMGLTFLFGSVITISAVGGATEGRNVAITHTSSVMEELRSLTYEEMLAYRPPVLTGLGTSETVVIECFKDDGTSLTLPIDPATLTSPLPNPLPVQCTVSWRDQRGHNLHLAASELYYR